VKSHHVLSFTKQLCIFQFLDISLYRNSTCIILYSISGTAFFLSFIAAGIQPTLDHSMEITSRSNVLAQGERRGIGWCVWVYAWRAGKEG